MSDSDRGRSRSRSPPREDRDIDERPRSMSPRSPREDRAPEEDNSIKAFVGGLPWRIEDADLRDSTL